MHYLLKASFGRNTQEFGASDYPSDPRPDSAAPRIRDGRRASGNYIALAPPPFVQPLAYPLPPSEVVSQQADSGFCNEPSESP